MFVFTVTDTVAIEKTLAPQCHLEIFLKPFMFVWNGDSSFLAS